MSFIPGLGVVKGMATTLRRFFEPKATIRYPEVPADVATRFRGRLQLLYDEYGTLKCETCFQCAQACPIECIDMGGIDKIPKPRDSKYGAYYFPWIEVYDPERGNIFVPPSGHMVGIYARSDNERGVHKAPANEIVRGALGLKYTISRSEQDILNPKGINCIRDFSRRGRGIRVWGARTISSDASWRYINVRRLFIMVEESIDIGMQWAVFEPNDHRLWKKITRDCLLYTSPSPRD